MVRQGRIMIDNNPWKPKFKIGDLAKLRSYTNYDMSFVIILEVHESEEIGRYSNYTVYIQNKENSEIIHQAWLDEVK